MRKKKPRNAATPTSKKAATPARSKGTRRVEEAAAVETPSATLNTDTSAQKILEATPRVFRLVRNASGLSAVLFGYIRKHELFKQAGFDEMREYARQHLGVESEPMYKKIARASKTGWKHYREHFEAIVQRIVAGQNPLDEQDAKLPSMTALALLSTALKSVDADKRSEFLANVLDGKIRAEDMEKRERSATKADTRINRAPVSPSASLPPAKRAFEAMRTAEESLRECPVGELSPSEREELRLQAEALAQLASELLTRIATE